MIRADLALLGIHHEIFASEAAVQSTKARSRPPSLDRLRSAKGLHLRRHARTAEGRSSPTIGSPTEMTLFRADRSSATIRIARCANRTAGSPISAPISPTMRKRPPRPTMLIDIWGADHAGTVKPHSGGGEGAHPRSAGRRGARSTSSSSRWSSLLRNGEPVKMSKRSGQLRHAGRRSAKRSGKRCRPLHHAHPQGRCADGFRLRQGGRSLEGQSGLLRAVRPRPHPPRSTASADRGWGWCCPRAPDWTPCWMPTSSASY